MMNPYHAPQTESPREPDGDTAFVQVAKLIMQMVYMAKVLAGLMAVGIAVMCYDLIEVAKLFELKAISEELRDDSTTWQATLHRECPASS